VGNESSHDRTSTEVIMSLSCSFCQHLNPADAKFCNECGAPRHLTLCARCDAINDVHAELCHACGEPLARATAVESAEARPPTERSSIVQALETIEGDVAPVARPPTVAHADHPATLHPRVALQRRPMRPLRPVLFASFVICALAAVLLSERLPLPPALSRASLAMTGFVPIDTAAGAADAIAAPQAAPSPLPTPASSRMHVGPIEASAPDAGSQPRQRCSDGVVAMALCDAREAPDVR